MQFLRRWTARKEIADWYQEDLPEGPTIRFLEGLILTPVRIALCLLLLFCYPPPGCGPSAGSPRLTDPEPNLDRLLELLEGTMTKDALSPSFTIYYPDAPTHPAFVAFQEALAKGLLEGDYGPDDPLEAWASYSKGWEDCARRRELRKAAKPFRFQP